MSEFFCALNHDEQMELNAGTAVCVRINETVPISAERKGVICTIPGASAKDIANAYASSSNRYTYGAR